MRLVQSRLHRVALFFSTIAAVSGCGSASASKSTPASVALKTFVQCNSTDTCRERKRVREQAYAKAILDEPPSSRIEIAAVTSVVLFERNRQTIYALDPNFVALDAMTGKERYRLEGVSGGAFFRAGKWIVVASEDGRLVKLSLIDPSTMPNGKPIACSLNLPAPQEAETISVYPFDRAGQPYLYWQSAYYYVGGVRPSPEIEERRAKAAACGIVKLDLATCNITPVSMNDFVWEPPEGRQYHPGEKQFCDYLSPVLDIPAAAASTPGPVAGYGLLTPGSDAPRFAVRSEQNSEDRCRVETRLTLEARNAASEVLWTRPLAPIVTYCGPP